MMWSGNCFLKHYKLALKFYILFPEEYFLFSLLKFFQTLFCRKSCAAIKNKRNDISSKAAGVLTPDQTQVMKKERVDDSSSPAHKQQQSITITDVVPDIIPPSQGKKSFHLQCTMYNKHNFLFTLACLKT